MTSRRMPTAVVACVLAAMTVACGAGEQSPAPAAAPTRSATPAPVETGPDGVVTYRVARFQFPALTVSPGATLRIVDGDSEPHTVTAVDGSFDSGSFRPDSPATLTAPTEPGTYKITCTVHPGMEGEIVVR